MKIHVLMENTAAVPSLKAEHGLSLYIETGRHKILFDAGQTDGFADNAAEMGLSLADVDLAILSHGHYDHGGGLLRFLQENDHAPVYLHRDAFAPRYSGPEKFIGLDPALKTAGRLIFTDDFFKIDDTLTLRTCNGRPAPFPPSAEGLFVECEGVRRPDDFHHEQYLSVRENGRHILISGCSHKGVLNLVHWLKPDVLVGGFHFMKLDPLGPGREPLTTAASALMKHPAVYWTGHCTGEEPYRFLKEEMGERLHRLSAGVTLEL